MEMTKYVKDCIVSTVFSAAIMAVWCFCSACCIASGDVAPLFGVGAVIIAGFWLKSICDARATDYYLKTRENPLWRFVSGRTPFPTSEEEEEK